MENGCEEGGDVVGLDDAACAPDFYDVAEVDGPFVLFVGYVDDAYSLHVGGETSCVDCKTEIFEEGFSF